MKKIVVIGNDPFVGDCLKIMGRGAEADIRLVVSELGTRIAGGSTQRLCRERGYPHLEVARADSGDVVAAIDTAQPDLIVSAYNMRVFGKRLLSIPKLGCINYHNGPLPKYRGVNAESWAIINGEQRHGVTWHWMDPGIDTGDILGQKTFPLASDETAFSLAQKSFAAGTRLLEEIWTPLLRGEIRPTPQDHAQATYYSLKQFPNDGRIDFQWPFERLERFLRGLDYRPGNNLFIHPSATHDGRTFYAQKAVHLHPAQPGASPGRVHAITEGRIDVCVADAVAGLTDLLDENNRPVTAETLAGEYGIEVGDRLQ